MIFDKKNKKTSKVAVFHKKEVLEKYQEILGKVLEKSWNFVFEKVWEPCQYRAHTPISLTAQGCYSTLLRT